MSVNTSTLWYVRPMPIRARLYVGSPPSGRAVEHDVPLVVPQLPAHAVEQRRLAGAVGTHQADALTRLHVERDVVDRIDTPEGLATPRSARRGPASATGRRRRQAAGARGSLGARPRVAAENRRSLESLRRACASGTPGCPRGAGRRSGHRRRTARTSGRRTDAGRQHMVRSCSDHEESDAGLNGPLHRRDARGHHEDDEDERDVSSSSRIGNTPAARSCSSRPPIAGDGARQGEDQDALPGRVDAEPGRRRLAATHGRQVPAHGALADQQHARPRPRRARARRGGTWRGR